jgi:hypothetical protein
MASKQGQNQGDIIRSFTLGNKELDGKTAEFQYDRGQYSITDVVGEERNVVYKSRNAQEAYTKWNVYIGRKKERPERQTENASGADKQGRGKSGSREESRTERTGKRPERAENRTDRAGKRQRTDREEVRTERAGNSPERENIQTERTAKRQEHRSRSNARKRNDFHNEYNEINGGNGGYNQGFTANQGTEDVSGEKGQRRPRRRRNNRRGQENQA